MIDELSCLAERRVTSIGGPQYGRRMSVSRRQLLLGAMAIAAGGGIWGTGLFPQRDRERGVAGGRAGTLSRLMVRDPTGRVSRVFVWRSAGSDSALVPVLYLLHGVPGTAAGAVTTGVVAATAAAVGAGLGPLVLVIPDGNGVRADTEWADASDGKDLVASRVIRSVIPAVEGNHPRLRRQRAIAGFSMGGYGAANLALQHPDLFGQWCSLDGYFRIDDPDKVFVDDTARDANSPDRHAVAGSDQRVLLIESRSEQGKLIPGEAARMQGLLNAAGAQVTVWKPSGPHSWTFVVSQWRPLLEWLKPGWIAV